MDEPSPTLVSGGGHSFITEPGASSATAPLAQLLTDLHGVLKTMFTFNSETATGGVFTPHSAVGSSALDGVRQAPTDLLKDNGHSSGGPISDIFKDPMINMPTHSGRGFDG